MRTSTRRLVSEQVALPAEPMVSVAITAYNSGQSITAALNSVFAQRVDFPIEIVVGDDASTDDTAAVVRELATEYPGIIRLEVRSQNLRIQRNYYQTFQDCRGKYIAWLDADDIWTHPDKLQIQVDALERDPRVVVCGHFVRWVSPEGELKRERYPQLPAGRYGLTDILERNFLPSPSVVFRRGLESLLPEWYFDAAPLTDWPLYALAAEKGDILLLDGTLADYTLTPNSNFWGQGEGFWYRLDARFYDLICSSLSPAMCSFARKQQALRYERLSYYLRRRGQFTDARKASWQAVLKGRDLRSLKGFFAAAVRKSVADQPATSTN